eukprot:c1656_g1_i1.p1 GENE.c1656_g1_i1~~c1656_g1_i1.p1  ORF type:complete len:204 (-),score=32.39 c1656_g1_i1:81-692(-)
MSLTVAETKIVLLGGTHVGKSSLLRRFVLDEFDSHQKSTVGASFMSKTLEPTEKGEQAMMLHIWDTAGQETYRSLAPMYYRNSSAAIIVFDITRQDSFEALKEWVAELKRNGPPDVVIALAGNKSDEEVARQVSAQDAQQYANSIGAIFCETSAKTGTNVTRIFELLASQLRKNQSTKGWSNSARPPVAIDSGRSNQKNPCGC